MIRAKRLAPSRPMCAFNPDTWRPAPSGDGFEVDAVRFRRKAGTLIATACVYHPMVLGRDQQPTDGAYASWIAAVVDNRYGGRHVASWDGRSLLGNGGPVPVDEAARWVEFLGAMLAGYPDPPAGYDGWWEFPRES